MSKLDPIEYLKGQGYKVTSNPHAYRESYPDGKIVRFGLRRHHDANGFHVDAFCDGEHNAWDLAKAHGAGVPSVADGGIVTAGTAINGNWGKTAVVAYPHLGYQVIYGHLDELYVSIGDTVNQGDFVGTQGATNNLGVKMASHLHIQFQHYGYIPTEKAFVCTGIDALKIDVNAKPKQSGKIVDISEWQVPSAFNYDLFADQVELVIVRTQYGSAYEDKHYKTHHRELQKRGVPTGAYAWIRGNSIEDMEHEAELFYNRTKEFNPTFWFLDVEEESMSDMRAGASAFLNKLRSLGAKKVGIYVANHLYKGFNLDVDEADAVWIPHYGVNNGTPSSKPSFPADIHQYTDVGSVAGYSGNLDLNQIVSDRDITYFTDGKKSPIKPVKPSAPTKPNKGNKGNGKGKGQSYTVKAGDTIGTIAQAHGISQDKLITINNIPNPDLIYAGQVIKVSGSASKVTNTTYTVGSGDNLSSIANMYGVSLGALQSANSIANPDLIYAGQRLVIPNSSSSAIYHTVKAGDTVSQLSLNYGASVGNIVAWNNLPNANTIFAGQRLRVY